MQTRDRRRQRGRCRGMHMAAVAAAAAASADRTPLSKPLFCHCRRRRRPRPPVRPPSAEGGDLVTGHSLPHSLARARTPANNRSLLLEAEADASREGGRGLIEGGSERGPARRRPSIGRWPRRAPIGQEKCARIFTAWPIWTSERELESWNWSKERMIGVEKRDFTREGRQGMTK